MALNAGTRLGPYEVAAQIGAGGMGEVYRATDTRLDRTVAIKVLPEHLADDPQRRERFEREAKAVSSLNHPHICTLHDVGEQDGVHYLVMELVEGDTLQQRLEKGRLPLDQALEYAIQIADALDKAHRHGVVHRDLKPGNIMITKSAGVKLLDFGLAKLKGDEAQVSPLSQMPTQDPSAPLTAEGTIIGTLQYMAPEQLEGKEADARTDIFAFGAVVYEMVTGKKAFEGASQASLITAIMGSDPAPIADIQPLSPRAMDRTIRKCLTKDPDERWQSAYDLMDELKWVTDGSAQAEGVAATAGGRERLLWIGLSAVLLLSTVALTIGYFGRSPQDQESIRFTVNLPPSAGSRSDGFAMSPDGNRLAFISNADGVLKVWIRALESEREQPVAGTEGATGVFWSPDGGSIGFSTGTQLKRVDLAGGLPQTICDMQLPYVGTWHKDGVILFAGGQGEEIYRVEAAGGQPTATRLRTQFDTEVQLGFPYFLPDGVHFLFSTSPPLPASPATYVGSLDTGEATLLLNANRAVYADGHLLFERGGFLMAQRFNVAGLRLEGEPQSIGTIVTSPAVAGWQETSVFATSGNGRVAFRSRTGVDGQLVWFDVDGQELGRIQQPESGEFVNPSLSPDDRWIAVNRKDPSSQVSDIWLIDVATDRARLLTSGSSFSFDPVWSPDGSRIVYTALREETVGLWTMSIDGGAAESLWEATDGEFPRATAWSRDGDILFDRTFGTDRDVWVLSPSGDAEPFLYSGAIEYGASFSPDGKWVAYSSTESNEYEVYVVSFPEGRRKSRISDVAGIHPRWRGDGKELFFWELGGNALTGITVDALTSGVDPVGLPWRLGPQIDGLFDSRNNYAVRSDGERFLMRRPSLNSPAITMITNWTSLLEQNQ